MERTDKKLEYQMKRQATSLQTGKMPGNTELMISTGSTLLDLAISGERKYGGGIPGGVLVELFGPEGSGKTVLLCEIAGAIQRQSGDIMFNDPEARLNNKFAELFDFDTSSIVVNQPDTVTEVITSVQKWKPKTEAKVHGIMTDSLAALSTSMEMDNEDGDKMGMRRAKEFSEGLRKICRILQQKNYIMVCSNQIRVNAGASAYAEQFTTPGGKAMGFYSSLRLRFHKPDKIMKEKTIGGKTWKEAVATKVKVECYKNSISVPYRSAEVYINFNYGIDDIRANLQFVKDYTGSKIYIVDKDTPLSNVMETAIEMVETRGLEKQLKKETIRLWLVIQEKFKTNRKKKVR